MTTDGTTGPGAPPPDGHGEPVQPGAGPLRPRGDAPTGGRIVIKKGSEREVEFRHDREDSRTRTRKREAAQLARSRRGPRGRPAVLLGSTILLAAVFMYRFSGRGTAETYRASIQGCTVVLEGVAADDGILASLVVRRGGGLRALFLREPPAEGGAAIAARMYPEGQPDRAVLLYSTVPDPGMPDAVLAARFDADRLGAVGSELTLVAEMSIGGESRMLSRSVRVD